MADDELGILEGEDDNLAAVRRGSSVVPPRPGLDDGSMSRFAQPGVDTGTSQESASGPIGSRSQERVDRILSGLEASGKRTQGIFAEREKAMAPLRDVTRETAMQPVEGVPQLEKPPPRPNLHSELTQGAQEWMGIATMIAMIGAGRTRTAGTTGLTAMAGIFNGIREGNEDRIKHEFAKWKASSDAIIANNKALVEAYKLRLENKKLDLDQKIMEMQVVASEFQDRLMMEALERRNLIDAGKLIAGQEQITARAERSLVQADLLKQRLENEAEKLRMQKEGVLTDEQALARARRFAEGDNSAFQNLGSYIQRGENMKKIEAALADVAKEKGWTQEQLTAHRRDMQASATGLRSTYTQEARMSTAGFELTNAIPLAEESLNKYWGKTGGSGIGALRWDQINNIWAREQQSPELADLAVKLNAVINPYALAIARGTGQSTDASRAEAHRILNETQSPEAAKAAMAAMKQEAETALRAPAQARQQMQPGMPAEQRIPQRPPNVPEGSAYSPSRRQWRAPDGRLFNQDGTPVQ